MKENTLVKIGTVLFFLGFLGITPVMAALDPGFTGKSMGLSGKTDFLSIANLSGLGTLDPGFKAQSVGQFGKTDLFYSGNLSDLSQLSSTSPFGKVSPFGKIVSPTEVKWDPVFIYYAHRNAHRTPPSYCSG